MRRRSARIQAAAAAAAASRLTKRKRKKKLNPKRTTTSSTVVPPRTRESLPEEMALQLLALVPTRSERDCASLLAMRLVSVRWSELALHRSVWRHRTLRVGSPRAAAALRLVPALEAVTLRLYRTGSDDPTGQKEAVLHAMAHGPCMVRSLHVNVQHSTAVTARLLNAALRRLQPSLVELHLRLGPAVDADDAVLILAGVDGLQHLEKLSLVVEAEFPWEIFSFTSLPSVRELTARGDRHRELVRGAVRACRRGGLLVVDVRDHGDVLWDLAESSGATLRAATVRAGAGLGELLLRCADLETLRVHCRSNDDFDVLAEALAQAAPSAAECVVVLDVKEASADGGLATVASHQVPFDGFRHVARLDVRDSHYLTSDCLLQLLDHMPLLEELRLPVISRQDQEALAMGWTADTAPRLRRLDVLWSDGLSEENLAPLKVFRPDLVVRRCCDVDRYLPRRV